MSNMYQHDAASEMFYYTHDMERVAYIKGLNAGRVLSQRFTAACAAMQGLLAGGGPVFADGSRSMSPHEISFWAVNHADVLLAELQKSGDK